MKYLVSFRFKEMVILIQRRAIYCVIRINQKVQIITLTHYLVLKTGNNFPLQNIQQMLGP